MTNLSPLVLHMAIMSINASKTWLIVKESHLSAATAAFENTEVMITTEGKSHLGAALAYIDHYVSPNALKWSNEIKPLSSIAHTQPHAAYAALTHGLANGVISPVQYQI